MNILTSRQLPFAFFFLFAGISIQLEALPQCVPAPTPTTTRVDFGLCCYKSLTTTPCGIKTNQCYIRSITPPSVTITPDIGNPAHVTLTVNNGTVGYGSTAACSPSPSACVPAQTGKKKWNPYGSELSVSIAPSVTRNYPPSAWIGGNSNHVDTTLLSTPQCTIDLAWDALNGDCKLPLQTQSFPMGPCTLTPQTKPNRFARLKNCPLDQFVPTEACHQANLDPVDPYSGDYYYAEADLEVPGIIPLKAVRAYTSSKSGFTGPFGIGTHLSLYNYSITVPTTGGGAVNTAANQSVTVDEGNGLTVSLSNGSGGGLVFSDNTNLGTTGSALTVSVDGGGIMTGAVYQTLDKTEFQFDANGRLSAIEDKNGNTIAMTRDGSGKLLTVSLLGRSLTFAYNGAGLIESVTDHTGRQASYQYDGSNRLFRVVNPMNFNKYYTWDASNRIQVAQDYTGKSRVFNIYDTNGMLKQQGLAIDNSNMAVYLLDATGALERRITDPNGNTRTLEYDANGLLIEYTDGLGHSTTTTYSANLFNGGATNRYIETTDALSHTTHVDLNTNNMPTDIIDPLSKTTTITYDASFPAQPATITDPMSHVTTFTYDGSGNLDTLTNPDNKDTTFTYNGRGQVLTRTNALSKTTTYTYNATNGNLETITDPLSRVTELTYDTLGRVTEVEDPKNETTTVTYDDLSRVTMVTDALNKDTEFTYEDNDTLTRVKNARNYNTDYTYDRKERLLTAKKVAGATNLITTYTYDAGDRLTQVLDPKGQKLKLTYDAANRLTQVQVEVSSVNTHTYTYTYDNADRLTQIGDGTNTWSVTYDDNDRVTQAVSPLATIDYTYNDDGQRTQMSVSGQTDVDYDYDVVSRLIEIAQGGQVYNYTYDDIGRRTALTRPNAVDTTYTYDDANQLTQILHAKSGGLSDQYDYTYDDNGNILTHQYGGGTRTYTYDVLNRLKQMDKTVAVPGETLPKKIEYTFDNVGNITQRKETDDLNNVTTYNMTYDSADRMTQVAPSPGTTVTYSYDLNSNMTGDSAGRSFTWNGLDQLTSMTTGGTTYNFTYDPLGRRRTWNQGGTTRNYFYDGLDMLSDGTSVYLNGAGIDQPLEKTASSTISTYLQDHIGSTTQMTNSSGVSIGQYAYMPYGKQLTSSTPVTGNLLTYTGREDDGTGLDYYRARYYDPSLELFISQDPYGDAQRYAVGNPLSYSDPFGLYGYWEGTTDVQKQRIDNFVEYLKKNGGKYGIFLSTFLQSNNDILIGFEKCPEKVYGRTQQKGSKVYIQLDSQFDGNTGAEITSAVGAANIAHEGWHAYQFVSKTVPWVIIKNAGRFEGGEIVDTDVDAYSVAIRVERAIKMNTGGRIDISRNADSFNTYYPGRKPSNPLNFK